jgi:predicted membrane-bound spermidine synthase
MTAALSLAFFLSGAAALVFETLWMRQAGLMLGNSVWASSLVMAAFMSGLAVGNSWAARSGAGLRRPLLAYALLELLIAAAALGLVLLFPPLSRLAAPVLQPLVPLPALLNGARMGIAFALMLIPAAAMGATLPVLLRVVVPRQTGFGRTLGWLYGWNTLGAVAGALAGDALLVERLGVRGTGFAAAGLDVLAAGTAAWLARGEGAASAGPASEPATPLTATGRRLLAGAALAGATLLCLEVVWFRFLLLFVLSSSVAFANMLAVVLLGIALGSLAASAWLERRPGAGRHAPLVALGCGIAGALTYAGFASILSPLRLSRGIIADHARIFEVSLALMLPVAALSGALFTLIGDALRPEAGGDARTAGTLTLFNTVGAALGALLGGLWLLPALGVERTLFAACLAYGVVALLLPQRGRALGVLALAYLVALALFPFGLMRNYFARNVVRRWTGDGSTLIASREGVSETLFYLRRELLGVPVQHRLATNGFSMATTGVLGDRYMRMFARWATAVRPEASKALLISYGLGETARALADSPGLQSIDVVDISRDVLEMGRVVFPPGRDPLDDPRVRVHVEDGRFFLLTTRERYDIITAEPPPPKHAGVAALYTRDYFHLIHERLAEGGVTTYWLPVYQMEPREAKAIVRGFCEAFPDCSLWNGAGLEWMLAGSRGSHGPLEEQAFARQWSDPVLGPILAEIGVETPEQLGALFIGDSGFLEEWTRGEAPLEDDHPLRVGYRLLPRSDPGYFPLMDASICRARFEASPFIRSLWPAGLRQRSLEFFELQATLNGVLLTPYRSSGMPGLLALDRLLTRWTVKTPVLWMMGTNPVEVRAAERAYAAGVRSSEVEGYRCARALSERDYPSAEQCLGRLAASGAQADAFLRWRVLALGLAGERLRALELIRSAPADPPAGEGARLEWTWLASRFGADGR